MLIYLLTNLYLIIIRILQPTESVEVLCRHNVPCRLSYRPPAPGGGGYVIRCLLLQQLRPVPLWSDARSMMTNREQHRPTGSEQSQVICAHTGAAPHSHTCLHVFPSLCSLGPHRAVPRRQCYVAAAITPMMVTVTRTIYACNTVKQRQTINSKTLQYITIESEFNHSYAKIHTNRPVCKCFDCFPATWWNL